MTIILGVAVLAVLALGLSMNIYYVREVAGGSIWWRGSQAYLFLGSGADGHHLRSLAYPWEMFKERFYAPPFPDDRRFAVTVIRVTDSAVVRRTADFGQNAGSAPDFLTPFGEEFYAMCPGMVLCKWTGTQFGPVTEEEQRNLGGIDHLIRGDTGNNPVNGWYRRWVDPAPGDQFLVAVGSKFSILVINEATGKNSYPDIIIQLLREAQPPLSLWHVNGTPRRVSEKQYRAAFNLPAQ
jgi:hypothetical protein